MKKMFSEFWTDLLYERKSMKKVKNVVSINAINNTWFYAGLFHDVCACLLALCDQLQAWGRERGDERSSKDSDFPVRAELLDLQISQPDSIPIMNISINYITRRHVEKNIVIKGRVEDNFKKILHANPYKALDKIERPWPFKLESKFYLNRNYLTKLNF